MTRLSEPRSEGSISRRDFRISRRRPRSRRRSRRRCAIRRTTSTRSPGAPHSFREAVGREDGRGQRHSRRPRATRSRSRAACRRRVAAAVLALTEPGDEALVLEPWYENYVPACVLACVTPRFVPLDRAGLSPRREEPRGRDPEADASHLRQHARQSFWPRLHARGASAIARLCQRHGVVAVTDEIYEHIWFDGHRHVSLGSLPGMEDRTVTLSGLGKTYAVTGWRVGWAVAAAPLTALIRKVHDYLTICGADAFQDAGRAALALPESYYERLRARVCAAARAPPRRRWRPRASPSRAPEGAYYVMVDGAPLGWKDDYALVDFLARGVGVIAVPGSSFYARRGKDARAPQLRKERGDAARGGAAPEGGGPEKWQQQKVCCEVLQAVILRSAATSHRSGQAPDLGSTSRGCRRPPSRAGRFGILRSAQDDGVKANGRLTPDVHASRLTSRVSPVRRLTARPTRTSSPGTPPSARGVGVVAGSSARRRSRP